MSGFQKVKDDFSATMNKMLDNTRSAQGGFARIYALYQRFQTDRFTSQNSSEGDPWPELSAKYADYKRKKFASFPGSGTKMMIASGTLAGAVIGPGAPFSGTDRHRAVFTSTSMQISVDMSGKNAAGKDFDYAADAAEQRPFMEFSDAHLEQMKEELSQFILGQVLGEKAIA